ncbi:glycogen synthase GlgA [Paenibacillus sacheonensis]|uniref:Glycogen synthase n=1 Tax=Paenibacillus sacheonensis TaxID=742054 RepID=A0A7X5C319_9BACL|nr:glycogen synthase GlgA [Paenibacillus sacheonensis]MBM7568103.1 starch synthase [Paenibacillus sacheonensis]NBC71895.1 glycogen synthase GlgA [Paenibacillus sacheonensis]
MKVWFAASEAMPLAKTGGLADVVGALPKALAKQSVDVTVVLPKYGEIPHEIASRAELRQIVWVQMGWRSQYCGLYEVNVDGVQYLLIDNEYYFKRGHLYGYGDEAERFVFFSSAVIEALKATEEVPDVLHCHDWQTGLVPFLLRTRYANHPGLSRIKTVFTIHNLQYQGVFSRDMLQDLLAVGDDSFSPDALEFYGAASFMKAGLRFADKLTTVSPTYAQEILTETYGEKMDGVLRQRAGDLTGIVNGVDTDAYDPMRDEYLTVRYRDSVTKKRRNKLALQRELGLPEDDTVPMLGIVSRFVWQKGIDMIGEAIPELMNERLQLVVLGAGEQQLESMLRAARDRYPDRISVWFGFNEGLARRIYASSDMYLMPSRFEPCGLSQLIALRYRTVPIVRESGGLRDTVTSYNEYTGEGNGFTFGPASTHDMLYTIRRALALYQDEAVWSRILTNSAKIDYGWSTSAREYHKLYRVLVG